MKKSFILLSTMVMVLLSACNKNLQKPEDLTVNPDPLTVVGGMVNADIKIGRAHV